MVHLLVRHKVADVAVWKALFDAHAATRKAAGCQGGTLMHSSIDPNEVFALFTWDTLEHAQAFAASADLHEVMAKAGITDQPSVHFLDEGVAIAA